MPSTRDTTFPDTGISVAFVALPLALSFGVLSGAGAAAGVYGAICTGILASMFGGTKAQISGPTGAMTVVLVSMADKYGLEGLVADIHGKKVWNLQRRQRQGNLPHHISLWHRQPNLRTSTKHDSDREILGQGIANTVAACFGFLIGTWQR